MKFCVVGDMHLTYSAPASRKDDFRQTVPKKLADVHAICEEWEVELLVLLGDVFSSPSPHFSVLSEFVYFLDALSLPVLSILGNHDVYGWQEDTFFRTALGVLDKIGSVIVLSTQTRLSFEKDDVCFYVAYPLTNEREELTETVYTTAPCTVALSHLAITPREVFGEHVQICNFVTTADYVFSGHYHPGYMPMTYTPGGTVFCNPGALLRISAIPEEIQRIPTVAIVDSSAPPTPTAVKLVPLASAAAGQDVFEVVERELMTREALESFLMGLTMESAFIDVEMIVRQVGSSYSEEIVELVLQRLSAVEEGS